MKTFNERFSFDPEKHLFLGIERECFLTRGGSILPIAPEIIPQLEGKGNYGYELSACQLELRTNPIQIKSLSKTLRCSHELLNEHEKMFKFEALHQEVAPFNIPLDVYPDPTGRYQEITKNMPVETLRAACRVAGTHVHVGMGSPKKAISAYNSAIEHLPKLCEIGDKSGGERLEIYKIMASDFKPPYYENWRSYETYAKTAGFEENPRNCWHLIRISIHGTIEFRMFGATPCVDEITEWAEFCHSICREAS